MGEWVSELSDSLNEGCVWKGVWFENNDTLGTG